MAFTSSEVNEDPEFFHDYFNGAFDTKCSQCNGRTTRAVMDVSAMTFSQKRIAARILQDQRAHREAKVERDYYRERGIEY